MRWNRVVKQLDDLILQDKNPRRLTKKQASDLQQSLKKYGVCEPIVLNTDNTVIGGHQRIRTLLEMGETQVECNVPDEKLEEHEVDELTIRLNKNTGEWDFELLANCYDVEDLIEWGFDHKQVYDEEPIDELKEEKEKKKKECPHCGGEL